MRFQRHQANKDVCRQLVASGFLDDLEEFVQLTYFEQFKTIKDEEELISLRMKTDIISDVLNIIRDNAS